MTIIEFLVSKRREPAFYSMPDMRSRAVHRQGIYELVPQHSCAAAIIFPFLLNQILSELAQMSQGW